MSDGWRIFIPDGTVQHHAFTMLCRKGSVYVDASHPSTRSQVSAYGVKAMFGLENAIIKKMMADGNAFMGIPTQTHVDVYVKEEDFHNLEDFD